MIALTYFWLGDYGVGVELTWLGTRRLRNVPPSTASAYVLGIDVLALELYQDWNYPKGANDNAAV